MRGDGEGAARAHSRDAPWMPRSRLTRRLSWLIAATVRTDGAPQPFGSRALRTSLGAAMSKSQHGDASDLCARCLRIGRRRRGGEAASDGGSGLAGSIGRLPEELRSAKCQRNNPCPPASSAPVRGPFPHTFAPTVQDESLEVLGPEGERRSLPAARLHTCLRRWEARRVDFDAYSTRVQGS